MTRSGMNEHADRRHPREGPAVLSLPERPSTDDPSRRDVACRLAIRRVAVGLRVRAPRRAAALGQAVPNDAPALGHLPGGYLWRLDDGGRWPGDRFLPAV